ncbi:hypothetical protein LTR36_008164 [Oleoguttula mirabilis]|uniref:Uncharacterized protein n=1 Tax=Oleoguttula mirabilis TaxID=1507867 RepID=A0AAV9J8H8_9PEZI|nr:hypothetical protein LTR36_008164 [Oleoguttula mirabilis]
MTLPPELRERVYEMALSDAPRKDVDLTTTDPRKIYWSGTRLTQLSTKYSTDAMETILKHTNFTATFDLTLRPAKSPPLN